MQLRRNEILTGLLVLGTVGVLTFVLILLGVLGGVIAFGFIGVFLGPTLLALGYSLISEWTASKDMPETEEAGM